MSTVDKDFADNVIRNEGYYNGDSDNSLGDNPPCVAVILYNNAFGGQGYALIFTDRDFHKYSQPTQFIGNPRLYWKAPTYTPPTHLPSVWEAPSA